jgi:hypothetical protein
MAGHTAALDLICEKEDAATAAAATAAAAVAEAEELRDDLAYVKETFQRQTVDLLDKLVDANANGNVVGGAPVPPASGE